MNDRVDPETGEIYDDEPTAPLGHIDLELLTRPFKPASIRQRPAPGGNGKMLSYLDGATVIRRLNKACGFCWSFEVLSESFVDGLLKAHGRLTIPGLGARDAVGVQRIAQNSGEDFHKGAFTDALKKCASLFGVGLELYGPDFEDAAAPATAERRATPAERREIEQQHERNVQAQAKPITENQVRMIAGTRTKKGVTDAEYRTFLLERFPNTRDKDGEPSTRALSVTQASAFIDFLRALPDPGEEERGEADQQAFEVAVAHDIDHAKKR